MRVCALLWDGWAVGARRCMTGCNSTVCNQLNIQDAQVSSVNNAAIGGLLLNPLNVVRSALCAAGVN